MVLDLISGDVLVKRGAVLFWTKQLTSTMLMCHELCSVENKCLEGSYCNGWGSQRGTCVAATIPLGVSLTIFLQYTKCIVSFGFWHFHFHILLASSVLRIALSHIEIGAYFTSTSNSVGELHPVLLHISQLSSSQQPPYLPITAIPLPFRDTLPCNIHHYITWLDVVLHFAWSLS